MIPVRSSFIKAVGYDAASKKMVILFDSRERCVYHNVPPLAHQSLMMSSSKGSYYNRNIKGIYRSYSR
jgi:hypothetical protein